MDVVLMLEENPHTSSRQTASELNISHSSILRVLTENQMHPYKLVLTNELAEDDFDRRILYCEQMMQMIDDNTLQIENVLFSAVRMKISSGYLKICVETKTAAIGTFFPVPQSAGSFLWDLHVKNH
ncbi:hypothetical protein NQ318_005041 [Aromia moschata]|uniref:Uncharacterized protein n=1 Tax=Aromia moschata TaxID=1265417 RepID=A0AAV8Y989_9CUCU|nr:hypothetical protein NQ318_005041 [Aromia moschata]